MKNQLEQAPELNNQLKNKILRKRMNRNHLLLDRMLKKNKKNLKHQLPLKIQKNHWRNHNQQRRIQSKLLKNQL
jgi:hypothetical protein